MSEMVIRNRQRVRRVNAPLLRRMTRTLLDEFIGAREYELCLHLVAAPEMAGINEKFLGHQGSTDVITFDHSSLLHGEIFICLDDAVAQAKQFRTNWQSEVARYIVHGILHLLGHDDSSPAARRKMKREENRLVRKLAKKFPLARLAR